MIFSPWEFGALKIQILSETCKVLQLKDKIESLDKIVKSFCIEPSYHGRPNLTVLLSTWSLGLRTLGHCGTKLKSSPEVHTHVSMGVLNIFVGVIENLRYLCSPQLTGHKVAWWLVNADQKLSLKFRLPKPYGTKFILDFSLRPMLVSTCVILVCVINGLNKIMMYMCLTEDGTWHWGGKKKIRAWVQAMRAIHVGPNSVLS